MPSGQQPRRSVSIRAGASAGLALALSVSFFSLGSFSQAAEGDRPEAAPGLVAVPESLAEGEEDTKVLCQYLVYSEPRFICGKPPVEDVKKRCDEMASEARGEPAECSCTDDQSYIQDVCD